MPLHSPPLQFKLQQSSLTVQTALFPPQLVGAGLVGGALVGGGLVGGALVGGALVGGALVGDDAGAGAAME